MDDYFKPAREHLEKGKQLLASGDTTGAMQEFDIATAFDETGESFFQLAKLRNVDRDGEYALELAKTAFSIASKDRSKCHFYDELASLRRNISLRLLPKRKERNRARIKGDLDAFIGTFDLASEVAARLRQEIAPSFRLFSTPDNSDSGRSKLGGIPDIPSGFKWPCSDAGVPLAFICQLCLDDLPRSAFNVLPKNGLLSFFYEACEQPWGDSWGSNKDDDCWRVFHFPNSDRTEKSSPPKKLPPESIFNPCTITSYEQLSFPSQNAIELADFSWEQQKDLWNMRVQWYHYPDSGASVHRLLGHPEFEQLDSRSHWADPHAWKLLLQVATDDHAGMMWGDVGMIYFFIDETALSKCDFSNVRVSLECS